MSIFTVPVMLYGDALVQLISETFQIPMGEARNAFSEKGGRVDYCGYSSDNAWRKVILHEGVPLDGGNLRFGRDRFLVLPTELNEFSAKTEVRRGMFYAEVERLT